ncbi:molybdopterin-binding protein [Magnetospira thiophila]
MTKTGRPTAAFLIIGNEVLSGRTRDANLPFLATRLTGQGIDLIEVRVLRDVESEIVAAINACRRAFDLVFTSGGIGPTHDDITAAAIAKAFEISLCLDPRAEALLRRHYKPEDINPARLKMAHLPEGAELILNPVSQAPGFRLQNVYVMAGVPRIFEAMFDGIKDTLPGGTPRLSRTVAVYLPEGQLAEPLARVQDQFPQVEIGSYPFARDGRLGAALVARTPDAEDLEGVVAALVHMIHDLGGEPLLDEDPRSRFL